MVANSQRVPAASTPMLYPMARRFLLTALLGLAGALVWEFIFDDHAHRLLGIEPDTVGEHWHFVLYETIAVCLVAAAYAYRLSYERALEESLAKYSAIMREASDAILIVNLEGDFEDANPKALQLLGRGREELLTMNFRQIHPPESLEATAASFGRMLETGSTRHPDGMVMRPDGTRIPVDIIGNLIEINGQKKAMGIFRDMSAQTRDKERVRLLEAAINRAGEMIVITDRDGVIQYANAAAETITGYQPGELTGKHTRMFKSGLQRPDFYKSMWDTLLKGKVWKGQLVNRHAKGQHYEEQVTISPIFGADGTINNFVSIHRDITEQKRLQQQILHADKLSSIGTFVAGVAHELNNPLTVVIGYANELAKAPGLPPRLASMAGDIRDQSKRAVEVVKNLLAYSRPHKIERKVANLHEIIRQTIGIHQYRIRVDNVELKAEEAAERLPVNVAAGQIQQVLVNIILNAHGAIKNTGKPGSIVISASRREGWTADAAEVIVRDDGPAIPPDHLPRLFDPYFTTKPTGEGTGLGLYISAHIVHEHGGDIWAENLPGGGSAFHFTLPLSAEPVATMVPGHIGKVSTPSIAGTKVLVVDDEPLVQTIISTILLRHDIFPVMAASGAEAVKLLEDGAFDVILSDYKMPVMDGMALYRWVEEKQPRYTRRFVFLTGALEKDLFDFCGEKEITAIIKPAEPEAIVDAIAAAIGAAGE